MKPARLAVLALALGAGGVAALMMTGDPTPPPAPEMREAAVPSAEVLVAASDITRGQRLQASSTRWQPWPVALKPAGAITRDTEADAQTEFGGMIALTGVADGDPIRREKFVKADGSGFMSAVLPSGMRAIAVTIDQRGTNSAGGFILPNDRVDVIRISRDDEASRAAQSDVQRSETVLTNVRVLAVGQTIQEKNGEPTASGDTVTLEVTSQQAEQVALAQKAGQLSLALRSLRDASETNAPAPTDRDTGMTVVRFGVTSRSATN